MSGPIVVALLKFLVNTICWPWTIAVGNRYVVFFNHLETLFFNSYLLHLFILCKNINKLTCGLVVYILVQNKLVQ